MKNFKINLKGLLTNEIIYIVSDILIKAIAFITLPFFIRRMSTAEYGSFSLYQSYISFFTVLFSLNVQAGIVKYFIDTSELKKGLFTSVWITLIVGGAVSVLFVIVNEKVGLFKLNTPILVLICVTSILNALLFIGLENLRAMLLAFKYGILSFLLTFFSTVIGLVLVFSKSDYLGEWRLISVFLATLIVASMSLFYIIKRDGFKFNKYTAHYLLTYSLPLIPYTFSTTVISQINRIFLAKNGLEEVGVYSFAANMGIIIYVVAISLNRAFQPYLFVALKEKKPYKEHMLQNTFLFYFIYLLFIFFENILILIFGNSSYIGAANVIPIIALGYGFFFLYSLIVNFLYYYKKNGLISVFSVISAVIVILLNYILIPRWGYLGAAIAMDGAYLSLFLMAYLYTKNKLNIEIFDNKQILLGITFLILPPIFKICFL